MARKKFHRINGRELNAVPDVPDFRDYRYEPALVKLRKSMAPPRLPAVLDQGSEGACTGFGLAAVVNLLNVGRGYRYRVSPRMLYEMARKFDEWPGERYEGSSCRGAIMGWYTMGVCRESKWRYDPDEPGTLSVERAKDARENTLGVYYRVAHEVTHFHAALNEVGALFVSADVHDGWDNDELVDGVIPFRQSATGGHAFAIVGYDDTGFWVQNSWGENWGKKGLALWTYEDWQRNITDAWVFRMGLPARRIWHLPPNERSSRLEDPEQLGRKPSRAEIAGHFVHFDDGRLHDRGRYWSNLEDVATTARFVAQDARFDHLLVYAHGGLNSPDASARRISAMKEVFKANGIYPYHVMYDTGLLEELKDVVVRREEDTRSRVGGFVDFVDTAIERASRPAGRALWREMKAGAMTPFGVNGDGTRVLDVFLDAFRTAGKAIELHVTGHSTGAIVLAHLLRAMERLDPRRRIGSCHLLAPAATVGLFTSHLLPYLLSGRGKFGVGRLTMFNLPDELELKDNVAKIYRKSLLYLVSRAFEESVPEAIVGMQKYSRPLESKLPAGARIVYSGGGTSAAKSNSESHGGFDNDVATMNSVLQGILRKKPVRPFTPDDLAY